MVIIKNLCEEGLHLSLLFVKQKDQSEHKVAVLKMAPEIRKAVNETGGYVYLGLSRCKASGSLSVSTVRDCHSESLEKRSPSLRLLRWSS